MPRFLACHWAKAPTRVAFLVAEAPTSVALLVTKAPPRVKLLVEKSAALVAFCLWKGRHRVNFRRCGCLSLVKVLFQCLEGNIG